MAKRVCFVFFKLSIALLEMPQSVCICICACLVALMAVSILFSYSCFLFWSRSCSSQVGHTLSFLEALRTIEERHATSPGLVAVLEDDVRLLPNWRCGERWWSRGGRSARRDVSARA